MEYFETVEDQLLTELLFDTNLNNREIADRLEMKSKEVAEHIRKLGLGWVRRNRGSHASRGQAALTAIMRKLLPGETVVTEYPIGERLKLDVYCPRYDLAAEFHGRQHYYFVEHFHDDIYGFEDSQKRDDRKLEICSDLGIALVVFRYTDTLTEDAVFSRLMDAIQNSPYIDREKVNRFKGNSYYEAAKKRQREYRKHMYRKMKKRYGERN